MLLPALKRISEDRETELQTEAKLKGKDISDIQIKQVEFSCNENNYCNHYKASFLDLLKSCASCSYSLCLSCCEELSQRRTSGEINPSMLKLPDKMEACVDSEGHTSNQKELRLSCYPRKMDKNSRLLVLEGVSWNALPVEQRDMMRKYIYDVMIQLSSTEDSYCMQRLYVNKLNVILVQILKHELPESLHSFIPDLVSAAKTSETICENFMVILKQLRVGVSDVSVREMIQERINELKQSLNRFTVFSNGFLSDIHQGRLVVPQPFQTAHWWRFKEHDTLQIQFLGNDIETIKWTPQPPPSQTPQPPPSPIPPELDEAEVSNYATQEPSNSEIETENERKGVDRLMAELQQIFGMTIENSDSQSRTTSEATRRGGYKRHQVKKAFAALKYLKTAFLSEGSDSSKETSNEEGEAALAGDVGLGVEASVAEATDMTAMKPLSLIFSFWLLNFFPGCWFRYDGKLNSFAI